MKTNNKKGFLVTITCNTLFSVKILNNCQIKTKIRTVKNSGYVLNI